jgi:nitrate reductase NapE component
VAALAWWHVVSLGPRTAAQHGANAVDSFIRFLFRVGVVKDFLSTVFSFGFIFYMYQPITFSPQPRPRDHSPVLL